MAIEKTVPVRAKLSTDLGAASGSEVLNAVSLHFALSQAQQADLDQLLAAQQNPSSPLYHQWLTPQQYGARFGISSSDMEKVEAWLQSQGLSVTSVSPSMNNVTVSGRIAQINAAFSTSIHTVVEDGVTHISNLADPTLPAALANVVTGITGLNDFAPKSRAKLSKVQASSVSPRFTSSISGNHYVAPGDFYTIYDSLPLIQNSITGSGISIAIAGQTDISTTDVAAFRSASGLSASTPTVVKATGYVSGTRSTTDVTEAQLDVEWSGASAPGANIIFVTVGNSRTTSVMDALVYAITNRIAPILTISYGNCESAWGQTNLNLYNQYFQQANAQGITVVGPSGDSGATDCDTTGPATSGLAVDFPASSPYVTGAGGTMFNEGSATSYWSSTNGSYSGSATGYIPEAVWNESTSTALSAGGGGVSVYFAKPTWQTGTGVPNDSFRDVPDVSFNAAASHDGYLLCSQGSCTNGYRDASNNLNVVGGTSVASPALAGVVALLEQQLGVTTGLGNINPTIYALANSTYYGNVFHDVTTGNNNSTCRAGSTGCASGGSIGYSAGIGYDQATGWGSLDVYNFATKWGQVTPSSSTSTTADFSLAASSTSISVKSGGTVTLPLTITALNGFTGSVSLSVLSTPSLTSSVISFSPTSPVTVSGTTTSVTMTINAAQTSLLRPASSQTVVAQGKMPWYGTCAGTALAGSFLMMVPRRRRWGIFFAALLSVGIISASGCGGGGSSASSSSSSGSGSTSTTTNSTVGTYALTITGTSGTLTHNAYVVLNVTN